MNSVKHGEIVYIHEINQHKNGMMGQSVRVFGTLLQVDPIQGCLCLIHENHKLLVDITCAGSIPLVKNRLYQVIGEMDEFTKRTKGILEPIRSKNKIPMILHARIIRNIDGLDVNLFEKVLKSKREFESSRAH